MIWWCLLLVIILYAVFETESRPYSNTFKNILQLSDSVNMLHRRAVLSSPVCKTGMVSVEGFLNPSTSFWSLGVPVWLQGSKALSQGSPWSPSPCPGGFPSIKQAKLCTARQGLWSMQELISSVTHHLTGQLHKVTGNCQGPVSPGHEWDPSWKQPVVSVSGKCAQSAWAASRIQVQTWHLVELKEAEGRNWEFDELRET